MKLLKVLSAGALLAALASMPSIGPAVGVVRIERSELLEPGPCPIGNAETFGVECATLLVPERHERPNGPMLELAVAVVRSIGPSPVADPVIYLAGGPGAGALDTLPIWIESSIRRDRDIVLLDQRGTGYSRPALMCRDLSGAQLSFALAPLPREEMAATYRTLATECAAELQAQGIDLSAYSTAQNADDVEALRVALGIETWNLYGISYGSRLALEVMRRHPAAIRSAVLDSVYPPDINSYEESTANLAAARDALHAACEVDAACQATYGDLAELTERASARYAGRIVSTTVAAERGGRFGVDVTERTAPSLVVAGLLTGDVLGLPLELAAMAAGSHAFLSYGTLAEDEVAEGMRLSIECAERMAHADPQRIAADRASDRALDQLLTGQSVESSCAVWPVPPADETVRAAVRSDIPTLLVSGALDAATPPRYAATALERLPNGHHVVLPVGGHGAGLIDACAVGIRDRFLARPLSEPDTTCTADPVPFRTDVAVNRGLPALVRDLLVDDPDGPPRPPTTAALAVVGVVLASGLAAGLYRFARRRVNTAWLLASVASLLFLGFGAGIALVAVGGFGGSSDSLVFGVPRSAGWLLWLPVLGAVATGILVLAVLMAWMRRTGSLIPRLHLTGVALAALALSWVLIGYGVIALG